MKLFVLSRARRPQSPTDEDCMLLVGDSWNDYGFRTLFMLHIQIGGVLREIGGVRILRKGQQGGEYPLPSEALDGGELPPEYASLGAGLDYYAQLADLGRDIANQTLSALRDVSLSPQRLAEFSAEEGFKISLNRGIDEPEAFYEDARNTITLGKLPPEAGGFSFVFRSRAGATDIAFVFDRVGGARVGRPTDIGPSHRVIVLVGQNGVGKTQLLARLARLAYATPDERHALAQDGELEGAPAFPSVVAVSYSAFDDFEPPRLEGDTLEEVVRKLEDGTGRYGYCGMRDLGRSILHAHEPVRLLGPDEIVAVFTQRLERVRARGSFSLLALALAPVFADASFERYLVGEQTRDPDDEASCVAGLEAFFGDNPAEAFRRLSSGHKIVLHQLTGLCATLQRRGLALIDEPETHLHPPLLAALMTGVRTILARLEGYAVVATHSPVLAQETLSQQVYILERDGDDPSVRLPEIETFGENTGALTREIFGLHTGAVDYRRVLDRMVARYGTPERIEEKLGGPLSSQALAHVMAAIAGRR